MFAVLQISDAETDLISRISEKLHPSEPSCIPVAVGGAAPFILIRAIRGKKGIPWEEIRRCAGRCAPRLLFDEKIEIPSESGIGRFVPTLLPKRLLFNTAVKYITSLGVEPSGMRLGLADESAALAAEADRLLPLASSLKIATRFPSRYDCAVERAMEKCGASITVSDTRDFLSDRSIVIGEQSEMFRFPQSALVITLPSPITATQNTVVCTGLTLPDSIERVRPQEIDPLLFAGALYELCGAAFLTKLSFDRVGAPKSKAMSANN